MEFLKGLHVLSCDCLVVRNAICRYCGLRVTPWRSHSMFVANKNAMHAHLSLLVQLQGQLKEEEEEGHWFMNRFAVIMSYLPGTSERRQRDDTYPVGSAKSVRRQPWRRTHLQLAWLASSSEMINIFILGVLVTTFKAAVKV